MGRILTLQRPFHWWRAYFSFFLIPIILKAVISFLHLIAKISYVYRLYELDSFCFNFMHIHSNDIQVMNRYVFSYYQSLKKSRTGWGKMGRNQIINSFSNTRDNTPSKTFKLILLVNKFHIKMGLADSWKSHPLAKILYVCDRHQNETKLTTQPLHLSMTRFVRNL